VTGTPSGAPRIGCVQYLNARPLVEARREEIQFAHPSELASAFDCGDIDVALVPSYFLLSRPENYVADGIAIASDGPVFSVVLAHRLPLDELTSVALDPASVTSVNLLRCILHFHGIEKLRFEPLSGLAGAHDAALLIGDQALAFRMSASAEYRFTDLGAEWQRFTGLPFVYAAWIIRRERADARQIAEKLRDLKKRSSLLVDDIIRDQQLLPPQICRDYLQSHLCYELGSREKAGLDKFANMLASLGLLAPNPPPLQFI
jgi:chorismate dehydratase